MDLGPQRCSRYRFTQPVRRRLTFGPSEGSACTSRPWVVMTTQIRTVPVCACVFEFLCPVVRMRSWISVPSCAHAHSSSVRMRFSPVPDHTSWFARLQGPSLERLGESGATHDSQSASRSGVEAWVARNLNGWDDSDAGLSKCWVRRPSGLASLHHSRLSTRSSYQLYSFSGDRRFCYDNHGSFVYDSPNLFCGPSGSVRTGLTGVRSEPEHRTHLTSLLCFRSLEGRLLSKLLC